MLTVYEHNESVCCQKVRIALAEKGLDYEVVEISLEKGEHKAPEYLKMNPKGVVPTLIHEGRTIIESTIILEYLDDALPDPPLMPKDPYWRARRRLWARWIDDEMHIPHTPTLSFNIAFAGIFKRAGRDVSRGPRPYLAAGLDSEPVRAALRAYQGFLAAMDRELSEHPWLAGPDYSLADIDVVPYIWRLSNLQLSPLWKNMPRVQDWFDRVTERKSFRNAVVDTALPDWIGAMQEGGVKAWPIIERLLAEA